MADDTRESLLLRSGRARATVVLIALATALYLWGIMAGGRRLRGPEVGFPFGWQWPYRDTIRPWRMLAPAVCVAALWAMLAGVRRRWPKRVTPRAMIFALIAGNVLFRAALTVSDPALLNAGPARVLLPKPLDYFQDARAAGSFGDILRRRQANAPQARLHGHSRTKPPGPIALARAMLVAVERLPWLRGSLLAVHRKLPRFRIAAGGTRDDTLLAAAILWAYTMTACAVLAAWPLYALARGIAGTRAGLCAAALWLFSPSVVLFSPEISQPVALLSVTGLWLMHEAVERGCAMRAVLSGLALCAAAGLNFSGVAAAGVVGVYLAARIALGLPRGRRAVLAAIVLASFAASAAAAGWFEAVHRVARYQRDGYLLDAGTPTLGGILHAVLLWDVFEPSDLFQLVLLPLAAALHLALFLAVATGVCRRPSERLRGRWARPVAPVVALAGTLAAAWLIGRYGLGVRPMAVFRAAFVGAHAQALSYLDYWLWWRWNPICFFLFAGVPAALLWVWAGAAPGRLSTRATAALFAVSLVLLCLNVSGLTRGEVERIWAPLLPAIYAAAGAVAARLPRGWAAALLAWHVGQTIVFSEFLVV